ncbi:MAG TPA: hypothetical protein VMW28_00530 [Pelolinea sp.]|nr:hypothetical protein [Pelolinea sp.]
MKQGMLWYDSHTGKAFKDRIESAVAYFTQKYGEKPEQCFVHPEMISGENGQTEAIKVVTDEKVLRNHIWIEFPEPE